MTLAELLGVRWPLVQAPMAGVQGVDLALAVSGAGGLGSLPCAMLSPQALHDALLQIQGQCLPVNLNFFCHVPAPADPAREAAWRSALVPYYRELGLEADASVPFAAREPFTDATADLLEPFRPTVISFHFGLPSDALLARLRSWGTRILSSATTVDEAIWLERHGVDAIIAQGLEAGGHRGMFLTQDTTTQLGTLALVPQIVRHTGLPVIAAGGIADASSVAAALALGACGVQVGTCLLASTECPIHENYKAALLKARDSDTIVTGRIGGTPVRVLKNRMSREYVRQEKAGADKMALERFTLGSLRKAVFDGDTENGSLMAGQAAGLLHEVRPVEEIFAAMVSEAKTCITGLYKETI